MRADLPDKKVSGVFYERLDPRRTFAERRYFPRPVVYWSHLPPRTQPSHLAKQWRGKPCFLFGTDEGKNRSRNDRHIRPSDQLQHAQRVLRLFIPPRVTRNHRDAEHLNLRRLQ